MRAFRESGGAWAILLMAMLVVGSQGCATMNPQSTQNATPQMTQLQMESIFGDEADAIVGPPGSIQTRIEGVNIYLFSSVENDRMRMLTPIARLENLDERVFAVLLQANFDLTSDARYSISDGVVYGGFLHPISSLSPELIRSAFSQVLNLAKNFGSSFSSRAVTSIPIPASAD